MQTLSTSRERTPFSVRLSNSPPAGGSSFTKRSQIWTNNNERFTLTAGGQSGLLTAGQLRVGDPEPLLWDGLSVSWRDQSQFHGATARGAPPRKGGFVAALLLGFILGGGLMALWEIYGSAPLKQPQADIAVNASNETAQAIKDLQTTQQKIVGELDQKIAGQLQSIQQTLASEQAETK